MDFFTTDLRPQQYGILCLQSVKKNLIGGGQLHVQSSQRQQPNVV